MIEMLLARCDCAVQAACGRDGWTACADGIGGSTADEGPSLMESLLNYGMDSTMDMDAVPAPPDLPSLPAPSAQPSSEAEDVPMPEASQLQTAPATQGTSAAPQSALAAAGPGGPRLSLRERMKLIGVIKE